MAAEEIRPGTNQKKRTILLIQRGVRLQSPLQGIYGKPAEQKESAGRVGERLADWGHRPTTWELKAETGPKAVGLTAVKETRDNANFMQYKNFHSSKDIIKRMKSQNTDEEKNIHNIDPMKDSYLEYRKNGVAVWLGC